MRSIQFVLLITIALFSNCKIHAISEAEPQYQSTTPTSAIQDTRTFDKPAKSDQKKDDIRTNTDRTEVNESDKSDVDRSNLDVNKTVKDFNRQTDVNKPEEEHKTLESDKSLFPIRK